MKKSVVKYLDDHPDIINTYIATHGLYNVYMRQEDCYIDPDNTKGHDIYLVATFSTYDAAEIFILENGQKIVTEQEENYGTPIIICMIQQKNYGHHDFSYAHDHTNSHLIAANKYPSYAFSKRGYNMLLKEHKAIYRRDWCDELIPFWIHWIKHDGSQISACDKQHIRDTLSCLGEDGWRKKKINKEIKSLRMYHAANK